MNNKWVHLQKRRRELNKLRSSRYAYTNHSPWQPTNVHSFTHSHRHTYDIDTEGIPSSSLIQASADWGLDWMEGVRKKGETLRCAGERAQGLKMGGERGRQKSRDQRMWFSLKVPVLSKYSIVNKRWLLGSFICAALGLCLGTWAWFLLCS